MLKKLKPTPFENTNKEMSAKVSRSGGSVTSTTVGGGVELDEATSTEHKIAVLRNDKEQKRNRRIKDELSRQNAIDKEAKRLYFHNAARANYRDQIESIVIDKLRNWCPELLVRDENDNLTYKTDCQPLKAYSNYLFDNQSNAVKKRYYDNAKRSLYEEKFQAVLKEYRFTKDEYNQSQDVQWEVDEAVQERAPSNKAIEQRTRAQYYKEQGKDSATKQLYPKLERAGLLEKKATGEVSLPTHIEKVVSDQHFDTQLSDEDKQQWYEGARTSLNQKRKK